MLMPGDAVYSVVATPSLVPVPYELQPYSPVAVIPAGTSLAAQKTRLVDPVSIIMG